MDNSEMNREIMRQGILIRQMRIGQLQDYWKEFMRIPGTPAGAAGEEINRLWDEVKTMRLMLEGAQ